MLKKTITFLLLLMPATALATPDPGQARREMLIGSDESHFYTFEVNRSQPGSYYEKYKSTNFMIYDKKSGEIVQKIPLVDAEYKINDIDTMQWTGVFKELKKADLSQFFQSRNFDWLFPEDMEFLEAIKVTPSGLVVRTKDGEKLVSYKSKPRYIFDMPFEEDDAVRIVSVLIDDENIYILVMRGRDSMDINLIQEILLVDSKQYYEAQRSASSK